MVEKPESGSSRKEKGIYPHLTSVHRQLSRSDLSYGRPSEYRLEHGSLLLLGVLLQLVSLFLHKFRLNMGCSLP